MNTFFKKTTNWNKDTFDEIIDVRSPIEYHEDHIVGSKNYPVLYDNERELIGKIYKTNSPLEAKILGSSIILKNISNHMKNNFASKPGSWRPLIYCWRGGQRSKALSTIFSEIGWRTTQLAGGYKFYRQEIIKGFKIISPKLKIVLISGQTGTAKTKLINRLIANGGQAIDLEDLANHKGSLLGKISDKKQPSQKFFESLLFSKIVKLNKKKIVFVESESSKIGNLHIPKYFWKNMLISKKIVIETPINHRVNFLLNDYHYVKKEKDFFKPLLKRIEKKIDPKIFNQLKNNIKNNNWKDLATSLLENHYDPAYKNNFNRKNQFLLKSFVLNRINEKNINELAKKILKT